MKELTQEMKPISMSLYISFIGFPKVLKLYAWEKFFKKKTESIRDRELSNLSQINVWTAVSAVIWNIISNIVSPVVVVSNHEIRVRSHVIRVRSHVINVRTHGMRIESRMITI